MKHTAARTNLFLLELVFNLFLFVLCAAACVALLIRARSVAAESAEQTGAVYAAQYAAARWQSGGVPAQYFDADWTPLPGEGPGAEARRYRLSLTEVPTEREGLISAEIVVTKVGVQSGRELYRLSVSAAKGVTGP